MPSAKEFLCRSDWRKSWTREVLEAMRWSLENLFKKTEQGHDEVGIPFDGSDFAEHMEASFGVAFVTIQAYVTGTIADLKKLGSIPDTCQKSCLLKMESFTIPNTSITRMELMDAAANYFKHHDEWDHGEHREWIESGRNRATIRTLQAVGIHGGTDWPCIRTLEKLGDPDHPSDELISLLEEASAWRAGLLGRPSL